MKKNINNFLIILIVFLLMLISILSISLINVLNENADLKKLNSITNYPQAMNGTLVNTILDKNKDYNKTIEIENIRNYRATVEIDFVEEWTKDNEPLENIELTEIKVSGINLNKKNKYQYTTELNPKEKITIDIVAKLIENNEKYADANYKLTYNIKLRDSNLTKEELSYATLNEGHEINSLIKKLSGQNDSYEKNEKVKKIAIISDRKNSDLIKEENNISTDGLPVYMVYDNGTIFWYTEAETIYFNNNSSYMFSGLKELKELEGFDIIDTSKVKDMSRMFNSTGIHDFSFLKYFNTSNVTDMEWMFAEIKTNKLDLSNFDTSKVKDMQNMFMFSTIDNLVIKSFNTSKVEDMSYMFGYLKTEKLDVSNFNTANVTDMSSMFHGITIDKLDLSNFDTSNVEDMSYMFATLQLDELDLSNFDTSNVKDMHSMFYYSKISNLKIQNFNTKKVTNMSGMFNGFKSKSLNLSNFDTSSVTDMQSMFSSSEIKRLDLKNFKTDKVITMSYMFEDTNKLEYLDISSFDFSNIQKENDYNNGFNYFIERTNPMIEIYVKNNSDKEMILKSSNELTDDNIKVK